MNRPVATTTATGAAVPAQIPQWLTWTVAIAIGLAVGLYRYLAWIDFGNDHFVHLGYAQQIVRGEWPVRDYVDPGIPLMAVVSAVAQQLFGQGLQAELILVATAFAAAATLTTVVAIRLAASIALGCLATLVPILAFPAAYGYPKLLLYAATILLAWAYCERPSPLRLFAMATALTAAVLFRHDHGVILSGAVAAMLLARHGAARPSWTAIAWTAAGSLLLAAPYVLWVQHYEGVLTYLQDGVAFSEREAQRANWWWETPPFAIDGSQPLFTRGLRGPVINVRWDPALDDAGIAAGEARHPITRLDPVGPHTWQYELRRWSTASVRALVRDPAVADTQGIDRSAFRIEVPAPAWWKAWLVNAYVPGPGLRVVANSTAILFWTVWIVPIVVAAYVGAAWRRVPLTVRSVVAMTIVVQVAMNATMLRDPFESRVRDVLVPTALLLAFLGGVAWRARGRIGVVVATRLAVTVALLVTVAAAAGLGETASLAARSGMLEGVTAVRERFREIRRSVAPPHERTGALSEPYRPIVAYLVRCSDPGQRILMATFAPELLFYSGRSFAGGHLLLSQGYFAGSRHDAVLVDMAGRQHPPLVVMDNETQAQIERMYPRLKAMIAAGYRETARFPFGPAKQFIVLSALASPCAAAVKP